MKKSEYMERHGFTLRKATKKDREQAKTDYQRTADYIISYNGDEWYSKDGSIKDMYSIVKEWKAAGI